MRVEIEKILEDLKTATEKLTGPPITRDNEGIDTAQIPG